MGFFDVRSVRFIKTTSDCPVKHNYSADYICLGHFDMMHIDELAASTSTPLLEIQEDRDEVGESLFNCPANCVYSLYLFKDIPELDKEAIKRFWEMKTTYTVVSRIHCDYPDSWKHPKEPFSAILEKYCNTLPVDKSRVLVSGVSLGGSVIYLGGAINSKTEEKEPVTLLFYDSLELGDTVAIMKSNSVVSILETVRCLSQNIVVRDTYTYCGIKRSILQVDEQNYVDVSIDGAALDNISTRCSIRDIQNSNLFISNLQKRLNVVAPQFYVTGTADLIIGWPINSEADLLRIMWALTNLSDRMHVCYNDVITRIGISQERNLDVPEEYSNELAPTKLENEYEVICRTKLWLDDERREGKLQGWKYTLLKLLGTLEAIYANYVMDDLAELLIPSVTAFLERIEHLRIRGNIEAEHEEDIIRFLDYWTALTNDIALLESQLTQHPELSPIRYYIPAMLLRFEQVLVRDFCEIMSTKDGRRFVPMLIPTDIDYLTTSCPLDPRHEEYRKPCPLLVLIPFKDLYHPWKTAIRISHEMAHYCDNDARNRNLRHIALRKSAAVFIAEQWYNNYFCNKDRDQFGMYHQKTMEYVNYLDSDLKEIIELRYPTYPRDDEFDWKSDQWYLFQSERSIEEAAVTVFASHEQREKYQFSMEKEYFFRNQYKYNLIHHNFLDSTRLMQQANSFNRHQYALTYLYAECFADIVMVIMLKCNFMDYYTSVYKDEFEYYLKANASPEVLYGESDIMRQIVRMAVVIYGVHQTVFHIDSSWEIGKINKELAEKSPLVKLAIQIVTDDTVFYSDILKQGTEDPVEYAEVGEIQLLKKYVACCANELHAMFDSPEKRKTIESVRTALNYVRNDKFDWKEIYHYINS